MTDLDKDLTPQQLLGLVEENTKTPEQQLVFLKAQTKTTGILHEAQLLNLKQWGAIAFSGLGKWHADINPDTKKIVYVLPKPKKKNPKNLKFLVAALQRSVTWLLGDDWGMSIKQGTNLLYDGQSTPSTQNVKRNKRTSA